MDENDVSQHDANDPDADPNERLPAGTGVGSRSHAPAVPPELLADLPEELEEEAKRPPHEREMPRPWMATFLRSLTVLPEVQTACEIAGISKRSVERWRLASPEFAEAEADALAFQRAHYQRLMHTWATAGLPAEEVREEVTVFPDGSRTSRTWTTRKAVRSERIAVKLLEAWYPERYAQMMKAEHSGPGGGPIQVESIDEIDRKIAALTAELEAKATGGGA